MKFRSLLVLACAALFGVGCLSSRRYPPPLRCEVRPYPKTSGLLKIEIREPAVVVPAPVASVAPEPMGCGKLSELGVEPDASCGDPAGPACALLVHPVAGGDQEKALPEGRFPVVLFSHGNNAPVLVYEALLERLAREGFIVLAPRCPAYARTAGDEAIWIARLQAAIGWLERAEAGQLPGDAVAERLRGHLDLGRIGVAGHSRGATESVRLLGLDARITAGVVAAPAATNQGQCPQSPLCLQNVVAAGITRPAMPTDAMDRCCHLSGFFDGADAFCGPPADTTLPPGCRAGFEVWTPEIGGQVFANPVDLLPKVDKPLRVLAAEHDGVARPFGGDAPGTQGGYKRRPIQTAIPTGCFWQEEADQDGDGQAWEYGYCDADGGQGGGEARRDGVAQVFEANAGPSQLLVVDQGLHCGFNQTFGAPSGLCDGPPHNPVYSFELDPATGKPFELGHLDPRVQFELFTEAVVEFFKLQLAGCENYLWSSWHAPVPSFGRHLDQVKLRSGLEIVAVAPTGVEIPARAEQMVRVDVRNTGPSEIRLTFSLFATPEKVILPCEAEKSTNWCFDVPEPAALRPGETRQVELRVVAGRWSKNQPVARLFARDPGGRAAVSVPLPLRVVNRPLD